MGQKVHPNGIRLGIVKPWIPMFFPYRESLAI